MRTRLPVAAIAVASVLTAACTGRTADESVRTCSDVESIADRDEPIRIVATVAPITNIVSMVASGGDVVIEGIVPEGSDSHTYEPAPSAAAALQRADVVFLNGLGLEAPTERLALANVDDGTVICELGDEILIPDDYIFDDSFPEAAGLPNPHLWTSPPMVREYVDVIRSVLSTADPANAERYAGNAAAFAARIDRLDSAIRAATDTVPVEKRVLLTYHDAYAYFARDYGWTVLGAVQPSSFEEPTPRDLARLIDQIRSSGVTAIFGSEVFPSPVLRQLASEAGVTYVDDLRDDDLPGAPGEPQHQWLTLMVDNMITIVEALGGDTSTLTVLDLAPVSVDEASYAQ